MIKTGHLLMLVVVGVSSSSLLVQEPNYVMSSKDFLVTSPSFLLAMRTE